jgi:repressor LexA
MDYQAKIANFYKKNRRMPTYAEIMKITGFKSRNAVFKLLKRLEVRGIIEKDSKGFVIPKRLFGEIRVLGTVEAGFPSPAEEELVDTMTLDEWLIKNKEATYMLKAKGDSMIEAGIMEGDMILVDRSKEAKNGDIVIARLNDGWTVKFLSKKGNVIMLVPGNKKYKNIIPKEGDELEIAAVVTAVIRKYDER